MAESLEFIATAEHVGQRLDQALHAWLPDRSRSFLQKLIVDGLVRVNERAVKMSYRLRTDDAIAVEIPPPRPLATAAEEIPLVVLYEDEDLIVVDKPPGMVVHPAAGNYAGTLVNALLHHCRGKLAGIGGVERPGIVHRLDKGTSGCIVVAKTDMAHQSLVAQFQAREVKKIYRAVCWGTLVPPTGRIETLIGRSDRDRKKMSARVTRGRPAVTEYRVLRQHGACALVELTLHTGRTHQIRVHMTHLGHPLVGDPVYGRRGPVGNSRSSIAKSQEPIASSRSSMANSQAPDAQCQASTATGQAQIAIARPLLHAYKLGLRHPRTGQFLEWTAPMPADMRPYE